MKTTPRKPDALSRDGHPVQIVRSYYEDGVEFAVVRYLDGHMPYPNVNGRVAGSEDDPLWEHRVADGKVLRSGGDYYNDADWVVERGLQLVTNPLDEIERDAKSLRVPMSHVPNDDEYLDVLAYRIDQELAQMERRVEKLTALRHRVETQRMRQLAARARVEREAKSV